MNCNHALDICCFPFRDDLTFEEFVERLLHWLES